VVLRTADGAEVAVPPSLLRLIIAAADDLAARRAVLAIAADVELTPAEAAELLGLSRPFVVRLLEAGDIPSEFRSARGGPEARSREAASAHDAYRRDGCAGEGRGSAIRGGGPATSRRARRR
jgi:hypothetical protein